MTATAARQRFTWSADQGYPEVTHSPGRVRERYLTEADHVNLVPQEDESGDSKADE